MSEPEDMSEQFRQDRIAEGLALLSRMTPAALATNRDELFFRAGETSAQTEHRENSRAGHWLWPAAAAVLAVATTGLGVALMNRDPQIRVVYVERAAADRGDQVNVAVKQPTPGQIRDRNGFAERIESRWALHEIRRGLATDGMIPRQDWLALSDAFAQQMRLQQERGQAARSGAPATPAGDGAAPRERARTYLELRDGVNAM